MSGHDELPLVLLAPQEATIIPFPMAKRVRFIRAVAGRIHQSRTQKEADIHWKRAVDITLRQMERVGVTDDRIDAELVTFREKVEAELRRLGPEDCHSDGELA